MPCYAKSHSQGEYVFDHGWADAYERAGGDYYPKLQVSVPFTPAPGRRLLVRPGEHADAVRDALADSLADICKRSNASSVHVTFLTEDEWQMLGARDYLQRTHRQFHWLNEGYATFDAFLAALSSRKRKTIRREREDALSNGITVDWLTGSDLTESVWDAFFDFYMDTGSRKWGRPYLTRSFYSIVGEKMRDQILLVMAKRNGRYIAGAINFIGSDTLFGRHWGCIEQHPFLHFEVCYYQAIAVRHRAQARAASRPAPAASTRSRAATCRPRPIRRTTSPIRGCGGRSPISSSTSAPMWRRRSRTMPRRRRSAKADQRMQTMPAYDQSNIFAKILRGEIPCHKVYEDDKALAFLDIMPRAPGHTLVIPKAPARNILDVAPDDLAHVMKIAQKIAKVSVDVFGADGVTLQQFSESAGGQVVFHLHVHVIPRKEGIALKPPASVKEAPDVLKEQAAKLAAALATKAQAHASQITPRRESAPLRRPRRRQRPSGAPAGTRGSRSAIAASAHRQRHGRERRPAERTRSSR